MTAIKKYESDQFSWEPTERCFYTDMAKLTIGGGSAFCAIADNRHGFYMVSARSGSEVFFQITHVEWSRENEILHWLLVPSAAAKANNPSLNNITCVIYND